VDSSVGKDLLVNVLRQVFVMAFVYDFFFLYCSIFGTVGVSADCPAGFTYRSTVNGGCYKAVICVLNWNDAGRNCRALHKDAHLLVINDAVEQSAVAGMLAPIRSLYKFSSLSFVHYARPR